jgi:hypothetical protein
MGWGPVINISKNHIGMPNTMQWIADNLDVYCAAIVEEYLKNEPYKNNDNNKMWIKPQIDTAMD